MLASTLFEKTRVKADGHAKQTPDNQPNAALSKYRAFKQLAELILSSMLIQHLK